MMDHMYANNWITQRRKRRMHFREASWALESNLQTKTDLSSGSASESRIYSIRSALILYRCSDMKQQYIIWEKNYCTSTRTVLHKEKTLVIDVSTINNKEENRVKRRDGRSKTMITRCALALLKAPKNVRRGAAGRDTKWSARWWFKVERLRSAREIWI